MPSQTQVPTTEVNDGSLPAGFTDTWGTITNFPTNGTNYATFGGSAGAHASCFANLTGFEFTIPAYATINGIILSIAKFTTQVSVQIGNAQDQSVMLIKGGTAQGNDKADTVTNWPGTNPSTFTYGGVADLWGLTWNDSDINNSPGFGIAFAAKGSAPVGKTLAARANTVTLQVFYTDPIFSFSIVFKIRSLFPKKCWPYIFGLKSQTRSIMI